MDMVERVARAIYCADEGINDDANLAHVNCWFGPDATGDGNWPEDYRKMARAAIEAMREPTDHMTFVGQSRRYDSVWSIGAVWRAMLDAALTPPVRSQEGS